MRLVLDTNIVVSGFIWGGVPRQVLDLGWNEHVTLFTSSVLLDELAEVLGRNKFAAMLASRETSSAFLMQRYSMLAKLVKPEAIERTVRDADDDAVLACALAAQANLIVSGDADLLTLQEYQGIRIVDAATAMHLIEQQK